MIFSSGFYISPVERTLLATTRKTASELKQQYEQMTGLVQANANSWIGRSSLSAQGITAEKCQEVFTKAKQTNKEANKLERQIQNSCWWRRLFNLVAIGTMSYGAYKLGTNKWFMDQVKLACTTIYNTVADAAEAARQAADDAAKSQCETRYGTGTTNPPSSNASTGTTPPTGSASTQANSCPPCEAKGVNLCPPCGNKG